MGIATAVLVLLPASLALQLPSAQQLRSPAFVRAPTSSVRLCAAPAEEGPALRSYNAEEEKALRKSRLEFGGYV